MKKEEIASQMTRTRPRTKKALLTLKRSMKHRIVDDVIWDLIEFWRAMSKNV